LREQAVVGNYQHLFSWGSFTVSTFYDDICDEGNTLIDL